MAMQLYFPMPIDAHQLRQKVKKSTFFDQNIVIQDPYFLFLGMDKTKRDEQ